MRFRSTLQLSALVAVAAACVAPTRTEAAYRAKAADTAEAVIAAGHRVLSRDHTAPALDHPALLEVSINVDWSGRRKGQPAPLPQAI